MGDAKASLIYINYSLYLNEYLEIDDIGNMSINLIKTILSKIRLSFSNRAKMLNFI